MATRWLNVKIDNLVVEYNLAAHLKLLWKLLIVSLTTYSNFYLLARLTVVVTDWFQSSLVATAPKEDLPLITDHWRQTGTSFLSWFCRISCASHGLFAEAFQSHPYRPDVFATEPALRVLFLRIIATTWEEHQNWNTAVRNKFLALYQTWKALRCIFS